MRLNREVHKEREEIRKEILRSWRALRFII